MRLISVVATLNLLLVPVHCAALLDYRARKVFLGGHMGSQQQCVMCCIIVAESNVTFASSTACTSSDAACWHCSADGVQSQAGFVKSHMGSQHKISE